MQLVIHALFGMLLWGSLVGAAQAAPCGGFTDVDDTNPLTAPFCANVEWVKNRQITLGCTSATLYCPFDYVSRLQMAAFLNRLGNVTFQQGGNAFIATATLGTTDNFPLELVANNQRVLHYDSSGNIIGGDASNFWSPPWSGQTIGGGGEQGATCLDPVTLTNTRACANRTEHQFATVSGGRSNHAKDQASTIGGGMTNTASGPWSTVGGGYESAASGYASTVPGGANNIAGGDFSVALGRNAIITAAGDGSFVFSDGNGVSFTSAAPNQFLVGAAGGVGLYTNKNLSTYCRLAAGGGTWDCSSSRHVKRDFAPIDPASILASVAELPISTWRFIGEPSAIRHLGPMAQDFRAAFGLGTDAESISQVDINGVALAAIQGLNAKLDQRIAEHASALADRDGRLAAQTREIAALKEQLSEVRAMQGELVALKAGLAELRRERGAIAAR